jgi:hypothetical protein
MAPHHHHHRSLPSTVGHAISKGVRGAGHAAHHVVSFLHHHVAASAGVAVLIAIVVVTTIERSAVRALILRAANWLSAPGAGGRPPLPPGS